MKRILTGMKPTGEGLHIGNYLGAFKPFLELSKVNENYLMLADLHALTSVKDADTMRRNIKNVILDYMALIPEEYMDNIFVFEQSKILDINNITWVLSSVTPYSLMLRAHAFKDSQVKNSDINMAVFNYPILMASDIISYDTDLVPVGKDQKQHLEFARDIAENFNKTYNTSFFKLPDVYIQESVATIPGLDGRKMSKSYDNFIGIFEDEKALKKKVMSITTDDTPLEEPKNPDTCLVFSLISFFGEKNRVEEIRKKYQAGGYGYGHAKLELLDILVEYIKPFKDRRVYLENNYDTIVANKLEDGNKKANEIVSNKYKELKKIVGLI